MSPKKISLDHLTAEEKLAYEVISRGLLLGNASDQQKEDYHKFLNDIGKNAIQHNNTDLGLLVRIFRRHEDSSFLEHLASTPKAYKSLLSIVVENAGGRVTDDGRILDFPQSHDRLQERLQQQQQQRMQGGYAWLQKQKQQQLDRLRRLAGDSTTDAPPPDVSKKKGKE